MPRCLFWLLLLSFLIIAGCSKPPEWSIAAPYFPPVERLRDGIVSKYYQHYTSEDGYVKTTDIRYVALRLDNRNRLQLEISNAAYQPIYRSERYFEGSELKVDSVIQYIRGKAFKAEQVSGTMMDWENSSNVYQTVSDFGSYGRELLTQQQTSIQDTIIDGTAAKLVTTKRRLNDDQLPTLDVIDTVEWTEHVITVYAAGIGIYRSETFGLDGYWYSELIEQMPLSLYRKRQANVPKRVAYISPENVMDKGSDFSPCNPPDQIFDYYNGTPDAGLRDGKRGLWNHLQTNLNTDLFADQSGYLTYRFVINCEGEAGYFITEEATLSFKEKRFPNEAVQHGYEVIAQLTDWRHLYWNDIPQDSYAYITLKWKNGELVEILP